jgi:hypothetical protein
MITEQTTKELKDTLSAIQSQFDFVVSKSNALEAQIADLEAQGIERGSIYMRSNGYMYVIYPMADGKRERRYIGPDVEKQRVVTSAIARAVVYDKVVSEYQQINRTMQSVLSNLRGSVMELKYIK